VTGLILAIAAALASPAAGLHDAPLRATGKWALEIDPTRCRLSRSFGPAGDEVLISIVPKPTTDEIMVTLTPSKPVRVKYGDIAQVTTAPSGVGQQATVVGFVPNGASDQPSFSLAVRRKILSQSAEIDTIGVTVDGKHIASVVPAGLTQALTALKKCENDLLQSWGVDPQGLKRIATPAEPSDAGPSIWFPQNSYPIDARRAHAQGRVLLRFKVDATGAVSDCGFAMSSGSKMLDDGSCRVLMKRAKYRPAIDIDGAPIASTMIVAVTWVIP
jgi:TonB family protein